eukprot:3698292-Amphidinium_carterae.1
MHSRSQGQLLVLMCSRVDQLLETTLELVLRTQLRTLQVLRGFEVAFWEECIVEVQNLRLSLHDIGMWDEMWNEYVPMQDM